jgi:hypothetical protein
MKRQDRVANLQNGQRSSASKVKTGNSLAHGFEVNGIKGCKGVPFKIGLCRRTCVDSIKPLCHAPALLDEVQFTVELWQEEHLDAALLAVLLKDRLHVDEVRLVPECPANTAVHIRVFALKTRAFALELGDVDAAFLKNTGHTLEDQSAVGTAIGLK